MSFVRTLVLGVALAGALAPASFAEGGCGTADEGSVTIYTRSGNIIHRTVADKATLDVLTRDADVIPAGMMIVTHGGKQYMVHDTKMPDGRMRSEMLGAP